jgi:predicted nucleotidyltransferase
MAEQQPLMASALQDDVPHALEVARRYTEALKRCFGDRLVSVVLYGSVARSDGTPASDIDLLVVARGLPQSRRARNRTLVALEEEFFSVLASPHGPESHTDISTKIKTPEEAERFTPLYLDMTEDATILYDQAGFFQSVLDRLRERLKALGAQRIRQGEVWYWKLKPDYQWGEVIEL